MVSRLEHTHHTSQYRRHARSGCDALLGAFHRREPLLEHGGGRIGEARIDVARLFADETGGGLRGILEHEAGSQEQCFTVLAELAAHRAGMYRSVSGW